MAITKQDNGKWLLNRTLNGRGGTRVRRLFLTKASAEQFEAKLLVKNPSALAIIDKPDKRRLTDLSLLWYEHHGVGLKDGLARLQKLNNLTKALGNPYAIKFSASDFTSYRAKRLQAGISANTLNHELAYLRAVFNELSRVGEWQGQNPLKIRALKIDERELSFLSSEQITQLLSCLTGDVYKVTLLCLATGARWSEAETIRAEQIQPHRVTYSGTKSGKVRVIPITPELYELLKTKKVGRLQELSCQMAN